jgi:hypothetical protein
MLRIYIKLLFYTLSYLTFTYIPRAIYLSDILHKLEISLVDDDAITSTLAIIHICVTKKISHIKKR